MDGAVLIDYMRVSKADGSQVLDLQRDALLAAGVDTRHLHEDQASGKRDDRLGRDLRHLVNPVHELTGRGVGPMALARQGASLSITIANGWLMSGVSAALARFERELVIERAHGRQGGRPFKLSAARLRLARAATGQRETKVGELCAAPGISCRTRRLHLDLQGRQRPDGEKRLRRATRRRRAPPAAGGAA